MPRSRGLVAAAVLIVTLAVGLAACGSDEPAPGAAESTGADAAQPTDAGAAPAPTKAPPAGQAAEPTDMANGRHPVVLKQVSVSGRTVTFDLVQWFDGDAATKAAAEDGEESPPPNDYYIRNVNPRLRTLPVAADAPITVSSLASSANPTKDTPVTLAQLAGYFPTNVADPFWITVERGQVTGIAQQYLP
jgi:hypothetical protein